MTEDEFLDDLTSNEVNADALTLARALTRESLNAEIEHVFTLGAFDPPLIRGDVFDAVHVSTGKSKSVLLQARKAAEEIAKAKRSLGAGHARKTAAHNRLEAQLGRPLEYPPSWLEGEFELHLLGEQFYFCKDFGNGPKPFFTYVEQRPDACFVDREGDIARRGYLLDATGRLRPFTVPAADLIGNGNPVARAIAAKGGGVTPQGEADLRTWFGGLPTMPVPVVHSPRFVAMPDGSKVFVSPTGETIPADAGVELADEVRLTCEARGGTEAQAVQHARALFDLAAEFPIPAFAILVGLAAPINDLLQGEPAVYLLDGPSSTVKSGQAGLAAACWAYGGDKAKVAGLFRKASGTVNSYESILQTTGSAFLGLDEVAKMEGKGFQGLLYEMQGQVGKLRMNADMTARKQARYGSCTVLCTAETDYSQMLREANKTAAGGDTVRFMPVSTAGRPELTAVVFSHIDGVKESFGHLAPMLVRHLFAAGHVDDPARLAAMNADYTAKLAGGAGAKRVERAARLPALLRVTAEIAREAGLAPEVFDADRLVQDLWGAALRSDMGPDKSAMDRAVAELFEGIVARWGSDIVDFDKREEARKEVLGYKGVSVKGERVIVLRNSSMMTELCSGVSARSLRSRLYEIKALVEGGKSDALTWSGFPGLGKNGAYTVLRESAVIADSDAEVESAVGEALRLNDEASASRAAAVHAGSPSASVH